MKDDSVKEGKDQCVKFLSCSTHLMCEEGATEDFEADNDII